MMPQEGRSGSLSVRLAGGAMLLHDLQVAWLCSRNSLGGAVPGHHRWKKVPDPAFGHHRWKKVPDPAFRLLGKAAAPWPACGL